MVCALAVLYTHSRLRYHTCNARITSERMFVNLSYTLDAPALTYSVFEVALVDRRTLSHIRYPPLHVHHLRVEGGSKYEVAESFNADSTNYADSPLRQDYGAYAMSVAHPRMTALIRDEGNATGAWSLVVKFFTPSVTHENASLFISGHVASPNSFDGLRVKTDASYTWPHAEPPRWLQRAREQSVHL